MRRSRLKLLETMGNLKIKLEHGEIEFRFKDENLKIITRNYSENRVSLTDLNAESVNLIRIFLNN